jgi:hypothetical protein
MAATLNTPKPYYQIRLKGSLDARWGICFEGLSISLDGNGDTLLMGPLADQAALHGLLKKVRDLGLTLLSVNQLPSAGEETNPTRSKE